MATIEGLPAIWHAENGDRLDLSTVPPGPTSPDDPFWGAKRRDWERWHHEVLRYRAHTHLACARDPLARKDALELCAAFPSYFVNVWCWVYEERAHQTPFGPGWLPAIQQEYMTDTLSWLGDRLQAKSGPDAVGAISKPRDIAATTTICQWLLHGFLFRDVFSAKIISRKEELVDTPGDMDSIIERIAAHLFADEDGWCPLPGWMRPSGIDAGFKIYRQHLKLSRPGSRNRLRGESTSKRSARGGRSTVALIDEAAYIDRLELLLGAIMDSTQCLILCSSESVETTEAFQEYSKKLRERNPASLRELDYWMNLYHDGDWLASKRSQAVSDEAFRREILRDAYAGFSSWIYKEFRERTVACGDFPYEHPWPLFVGIDPGYSDETALGWVTKDPATDRYRLVEGGTWRLQEPEFYAHILAGSWLMPDGQPCEFTFSPSDYALMDWAFTLPRPTLCGDPSGWARKSSKADSTYDRIQRRYKLITGRGLDIRVNWADEVRPYQARWNALRALLRRLDFNDTAGVRYIKSAIEYMRLEEEHARGRTSEQRTPRHNWASHPASMMEFLAVNLDLIDLLHSTTITEAGVRLPGRERITNIMERQGTMERQLVEVRR